MFDISNLDENEIKAAIEKEAIAEAPAEVEPTTAHETTTAVESVAGEILTPATVGPPISAAPKEVTPTEAPDELTKVEREELAVKNANMLVNLSDLLVSRLCGLLSGNFENYERYKLHQLEKAEFIEVTAEYLKSLRAKISPALVFFTSSVTIFSSIIFRAYADRKKHFKEKELKEKIEAAAEAETKNLQAEQGRTEAPRAETTKENLTIAEAPVRKKILVHKEEIPEAVNQRSNFEIFTEKDKPKGVSSKWDDKLIGHYKKSAGNDRMTLEEVLKEGTKPSILVERLIKADREKGKAWPQINKELRRYLRELPSFGDE